MTSKRIPKCQNRLHYRERRGVELAVQSFSPERLWNVQKHDTAVAIEFLLIV